MLKDYDCAIEYQSSKVNVVTHALIRKSMIELRAMFAHLSVTGGSGDFDLNADGVLSFQRRLCVPNDDELWHAILFKAYSTPYAMHPGSSKMYCDLREMYRWPGLK
ncbi:DNA/RNA polymerases superfamily protein [Gossypium australe]|uniref:DNA/RNA polymerases superfamily protein n=1 Tax=Gossypium australe TaxID=47621 RepID=A0A5B6UWX9_9ROSI|nr:DNA/RNA polymerases superfamily protein [Gossypium australe]